MSLANKGGFGPFLFLLCFFGEDLKKSMKIDFKWNCMKSPDGNEISENAPKIN